MHMPIQITTPTNIVSIPGITSQDNLLQVYTGSQYNDHVIGLSYQFLEFLANSIITREMCEVRQKYPDRDWSKVQTMIDSKEQEMRNLGYTILYECTIYTGRIVEAVYHQNTYHLETIIKEFSSKNSTNIMGTII